MKSEKRYQLTNNGDNSLKQLLERFYVIPKDYEVISAEDRATLDKYQGQLSNQLVANGENGYIVFRGVKPKKLSQEQIEEIKADSSSTQRELAFKYNVSNGTINKIKNNKY